MLKKLIILTSVLAFSNVSIAAVVLHPSGNHGSGHENNGGGHENDGGDDNQE